MNKAPVAIAIVRDISQRGYYSEIYDCRVRADGWLFDPSLGQWFSPDNVISVSTFTPRAWDGNGLKSGMLCEYKSWVGVTSARPTGLEVVSVLLVRRDAMKKRWEILMPSGETRTVKERNLVPLLEADPTVQPTS